MPAPTPTDRRGWHLRTLHDYDNGGHTFHLGNHGIAVAPNRDFVYLGQPTNVGGSSTTGGIYRIDTSDYSISLWATVSAAIRGLVGDASGNVYALLSDSTIDKVSHAGTVTAGWAALPSDWTAITDGFGIGRDDNLYVVARHNNNVTTTIFRISLAATVEEVGGLRVLRSTAHYSYVGASSDDIIWVSLDPPPAPNDGVNTTLRRWDPDGTSTFGANILPADDATFDTTVGAHWTTTHGTVGRDTTSPHAGAAVLRLTLPDNGGVQLLTVVTGDGYLLWRAQTGDRSRLTGWARANDHDAFIQGAVSYLDHDGNVIGASYETTDGHALPVGTWVEFDTDEVVGLDLKAPQGTEWARLSFLVTEDDGLSNSVDLSDLSVTLQHDGAFIDVGIQELVDAADDGDTEAYGGLFVDYADRVIVPMITYQGGGGVPDLGWFLAVAPDGTVTYRIAGTWDYGGSPPPAATSTNIADGPLGTSLAAETDRGAGMTFDGRHLYFIDDGDQPVIGFKGTLLRTLDIQGLVGAPLQIRRTDGLGYSSGPPAIRPSRGDPSGLTIGRTP